MVLSLRRKVSKLNDEVREAAEADLETFITLIHPQRLLGHVHKDLITWWCREEAKSHQLVLLPRDHAKSAMVAYRIAWEITKDPSIRVLYISSTSTLAIRQLKFIKDILTCRKYRKYWRNMVNEEEGKREKWTETEISVDHPKRKEEAIRDPTVFTAGLTTGITGSHCDIAVLDDVVAPENGYTKEGRKKVQSQYSMLSSIEAGDAREWIVGTRYNPDDLYNDLQAMTVEIFDSEGALVSDESLYEVYERQVEDNGDGSGEYLWPKQQRYDGKWFGFDQNILARKKAQYLDKTQFFCQYYNNPNKQANGAFDVNKFQYYERKYLTQKEGNWFFKDKKLNVFAAIDFAFSLREKADYTALVVVGITSENDYYILDIHRFKTDVISKYFEYIYNTHVKWGYRKILAEITVAQKVIVKELKDNHIKKHGLALSIEEFLPTRNEGDKEERVNAILEPKYSNLQIWHYKGGNCQTLEDELIMARPSHDDVKESLSNACRIAIPPRKQTMNNITQNKVIYHSRFGGCG